MAGRAEREGVFAAAGSGKSFSDKMINSFPFLMECPDTTKFIL